MVTLDDGRLYLCAVQEVMNAGTSLGADQMIRGEGYGFFSEKKKRKERSLFSKKWWKKFVKQSVKK